MPGSNPPGRKSLWSIALRYAAAGAFLREHKQGAAIFGGWQFGKMLLPQGCQLPDGFYVLPPGPPRHLAGRPLSEI